MTIKQFFPALQASAPSSIVYNESTVTHSHFKSAAAGLDRFLTRNFEEWFNEYTKSRLPGKIGQLIDICKEDYQFELEMIDEFNRTMKRPLLVHLNK
jgi:hypothetical protein